MTDLPDDAIVTAGDVATLIGVDPKTVARWATQGKLPHLRTLGGHRRFRVGDVRSKLADAQR